MSITADKTHNPYASGIPGFYQFGLILVVLLALFAPPVLKPIGYSGSSGKTIPEKFVLEFYNHIDQGAYNRIVPYWIEGDWNTEGVNNYQVSAIKSHRQVLDALKDNYGAGGWRIRFIDLETHGARQCLVKDLPRQLHREKQVLEFAGFENSPVTIVGLSGHTTGRCSIHDWQRELVLVDNRGKYRLIFRGVPPMYHLLHREQLFFPRGF